MYTLSVSVQDHISTLKRPTIFYTVKILTRKQRTFEYLYIFGVIFI